MQGTNGQAQEYDHGNQISFMRIWDDDNGVFIGSLGSLVWAILVSKQTIPAPNSTTSSTTFNLIPTQRDARMVVGVVFIGALFLHLASHILLFFDILWLPGTIFKKQGSDAAQKQGDSVLFLHI